MSATGHSQMYHVSQYDGPDPVELIRAILREAPWLYDYGLRDEPIAGKYMGPTGLMELGEVERGHGVREAPVPTRPQPKWEGRP